MSATVHERYPISVIIPENPDSDPRIIVRSPNFQYTFHPVDDGATTSARACTYQYEIAENEGEYRRLDEDYEKVAKFRSWLAEQVVAKCDMNDVVGLEWGIQVNEVVGKLIDLLEELAGIDGEVQGLREGGSLAF